MSYKGRKSVAQYDSAEGYDLYAPYYEKDHAYLDSFERSELFELMGDVQGLEVLDVGCGTGRMVENLKKFGAKVTGVDVSEKMLAIAKKRFSTSEFVLGDIEDLPFEDESFDMVVATFVIVHLAALQRAFDEVYRVLKPGGVFLLSNINQRKAPKLKVEKEEILIRSYYHRPEAVSKALEESFFAIEADGFVQQDGVWINQLVKARKS